MGKKFAARFLYGIALALLCVSWAAGQSSRVRPTPTPTPDEDTVRVETEEIKLNILALNEEGEYVSDVNAADLVITDNDILHQATSLRSIPANVLIVLDTGGEMRYRKTLDQTQRTAQALVSSLKPTDSVAIMQYSDRPELVLGFTQDREKIGSAIEQTRFGRRSAFVNAIEMATDLLTEIPQDNRHLVLITDGTDSYYGSSEKAAALRRLLSTDISVHVISYTKMEANDIEPRTKAITNTPPPKALPDEVAATLPNGVRDIAQAPKIGPTIIVDRKHLKKMRERRDDLEASEVTLGNLAENTNGTFIVPLDEQEMIDKTASVARYIDSSYVLTYMPKIAVGETPDIRTITVTSKRPGLIVQAKRRFILPARL